MLFRLATCLILFPALVYRFELWYFRDTLDVDGTQEMIMFFTILALALGVIVFLLHLPSVMRDRTNKAYYKSMKWDAETIRIYEEDLKKHEDVKNG